MSTWLWQRERSQERRLPAIYFNLMTHYEINDDRAQSKIWRRREDEKCLAFISSPFTAASADKLPRNRPMRVKFSARSVRHETERRWHQLIEIAFRFRAGRSRHLLHSHWLGAKIASCYAQQRVNRAINNDRNALETSSGTYFRSSRARRPLTGVDSETSRDKLGNAASWSCRRHCQTTPAQPAKPKTRRTINNKTQHR